MGNRRRNVFSLLVMNPEGSNSAPVADPLQLSIDKVAHERPQ